MSEETRTQETSQEEPQGQTQFSIKESDEYSHESPEESNGQTEVQTSEGETAEPQGEPQEETSVEVDEKGRTSDSNPYWQAKYDREKAEWEARLKELEEKAGQQQQQPTKPEPTQQEELAPPKPPQMPVDTSDYDAMEKYHKEYSKYEKDLLKYQLDQNQKELKEIKGWTQKQQEEYQKQQQMAQERAYYTQSLTKAGADEREADNIYKFFSSKDSLAPENLVVMYRAVRNQYANPQRKSEIEARGKRQGEPLPPTATTSESELPEKPDFFGDLVQYSKTQY